jgi:hypothetical protein
MKIIIDNYHETPSEIIFDADNENDFTNNKQYTMFCNNFFAKMECTNDKCTYAHSVEQLRRRICNKGIGCKNKKCIFKHPNQSDEDFLTRCNLKADSQRNQIKSAVVNLNEGRDSDEYILESIKIARMTGRKAITLIF